MNKVLPRLLVFFIGLPLVVTIICFNQFHHILMHFCVFAVSLLAASELYHLLFQKFSMQFRPLVIISAVLPVFVAAFCAIFELNPAIVDFTFIASLFLCMAHEVLASKTFENSVSHLLSSVFIIFYSGYLPSFISRMTLHNHSREHIALFVLMVCMCDSIAWLFGNLFGKNNKGFIKASPNKSIAGFLGGILGTLCTGFAAYKLFPEVFSISLVKMLLWAFFISIFSIIGDLVESVLKRSVEIKDSGSIVPGRGGILDSIDSIFFVAPIYYFGINFFF